MMVHNDSMYIYTYMHIYTHTYIYIYTHTHIYMQRWSKNKFMVYMINFIKHIINFVPMTVAYMVVVHIIYIT